MFCSSWLPIVLTELIRYFIDSIYEFCLTNSIKIYIVSGPGYAYYDGLKQHLSNKKNVSLTHATGVISEIMSKVEFAFTSNGRTVYELAHMNVPSVIISQHAREQTHDLSNIQNGMINIGIIDKNNTGEKIIKTFKKVTQEKDFRHELFMNLSCVGFLRQRP